MTPLNSKNSLDESTGSIKVTHNNAMNANEQSTKTPWFLRLPEAILRKNGLLAVLAVGVNAAAPFLKSKMEKAAAVASQVGAAILKSKKAISAAAASILGDIQPKPPKIAENRLAKAKARLASIPLFALLIASFIASPNGMAGFRGIWTPFYERTEYWKQTHTKANVPLLGQVTTPIVKFYGRTYQFSSAMLPPSASVAGHVSETEYDTSLLRGSVLFPSIETSHQTTYYSLGRVSSYELYRDASNNLQFRFTNNHLDLVHHTKVGKRTTYTSFEDASGKYKEKTVEVWKNWVHFPKSKPYASDPDYSVEMRTFFGVWELDSVEAEDGGHRMCESSRVNLPGPAIVLTPCVPSGVTVPENDPITFDFYTVLVPDSDDDE